MLSGATMLTGPRPNKHALNIVERPLPRTRAEVPTVSLSAYAFLFSELISYAMDRSASITELEERWVVCVCVCVCMRVWGPGGTGGRRGICGRWS